MQPPPPLFFSVSVNTYTGLSRQGYGFSSSHVWMWELDHKESWALKNYWFWTVVVEKTLESPLDCKEIQPVHPKGNQSWIFIERTDEAETPNFGHLMQRTDSLEKTLMLGKLKSGGEENDRGWDGWMASLTWWMWIWASSKSWWWPGKPSVLQSMGSQTVGNGWVTELHWSVNMLISLGIGICCSVPGIWVICKLIHS